jgi:hypothetical protein
MPTLIFKGMDSNAIMLGKTKVALVGCFGVLCQFLKKRDNPYAK